MPTKILCNLMVIAALSTPVWAAPRTFTISIDDWARPRSGERIIAFPELRDLTTVWSTAPEGSMIEIRYPGGDEGGLWAGELRDWLIALGVASEHIRLTPGSARVDRIELIIKEPKHQP